MFFFTVAESNCIFLTSLTFDYVAQAGPELRVVLLLCLLRAGNTGMCCHAQFRISGLNDPNFYCDFNPGFNRTHYKGKVMGSDKLGSKPALVSSELL